MKSEKHASALLLRIVMAFIAMITVTLPETVEAKPKSNLPELSENFSETIEISTKDFAVAIVDSVKNHSDDSEIVFRVQKPDWEWSLDNHAVYPPSAFFRGQILLIVKIRGEWAIVYAFSELTSSRYTKRYSKIKELKENEKIWHELISLTPYGG